MLIVRLTYDVAVAKTSIICWSPLSMYAKRLQSSVKRGFLISCSIFLVLAHNLHKLNMPPSVLNLTWTPLSVLDNASFSMASKKSTNRIAATTQPCFTPFVMGNELENLLLAQTLAFILSCNCLKMLMNFGGHPFLYTIFQSTFTWDYTEGFCEVNKHCI